MPIKYGDFSSLVQLGVGLHVGTALLQLYGELAVEPLTRTLDRTRTLFLAPQNEAGEPIRDFQDPALLRIPQIRVLQLSDRRSARDHPSNPRL